MNPMVKIESKPTLHLNGENSNFKNFDEFKNKIEDILKQIKPILSIYDILIVSCDSLLLIVSCCFCTLGELMF